MKLIALLWALGWKMSRKSQSNPVVQDHIGDKELIFQLQTYNGVICRQFCVANRRISSRWGKHSAPTLVISFESAALGAEVLTSDSKKLAFMQALQTQKAKIEGDLTLFNWYVELGSLLNN
ncbi:MAG: helicase [Gammaproteobacteria bacterium]|nr:MAG: helicase [Gammaproteobacteria bacterium]